MIGLSHEEVALHRQSSRQLSESSQGLPRAEDTQSSRPSPPPLDSAEGRQADAKPSDGGKGTIAKLTPQNVPSFGWKVYQEAGPFLRYLGGISDPQVILPQASFLQASCRLLTITFIPWSLSSRLRVQDSLLFPEVSLSSPDQLMPSIHDYDDWIL